MTRRRPIPGLVEDRDRPTVGQHEDRNLPANSVRVDGRRIRGQIPYGIESRDLGGWREVIDAGALNGADLSGLVATVDHAGIPLGRHPTTLELEDRGDAMHWSVEPPESRADVREAVQRGDLAAGSWRMVVAEDRWDGDVRHVTRIAELRDVSIVTRAAYDAAHVELRSEPGNRDPRDRDGDRRSSAGTLRVEDRNSAPPARGLAEEFRSAGFPGERAEIGFEEFRAATWTGSVDDMAPVRRDGVPLGADQRYAWPAFPRVPVDSGATSVDVLSQSSRTLAAAADVVRAIDAVTAKPETDSVLAIAATSLKQLATVQSAVPNVYLEQAAFNTVIEQDLRLALNDAYDKLVLDAIAAAGFQDPSTDPLLVSIRKAITTIRASGYNPDTLILDPTSDEDLDVLVSGITGGTNDFVFAPASFAPGTIFGLRRRVSKTAAAPVVVDAAAFGKVYAGPVSLARFEENDGSTNTSLVRLEGNAVFGTERSAAAVRIAAA